MTPEGTLAACLAIPVLGAAGIAACHRWPNLREAVSLAAAAALLTLLLSLSEAILEGERPSVHLHEILPGLALELALEPLGLLFALIAS
ncbi:MAG: hypothetical protein ACREUO_03985, partial [Burkholderiales bacterium]